MILIKLRYVFNFLIVSILCSCSSLDTSGISGGLSSYLPDSFTSEKIMKVHQGMNSKEILMLFGDPKNIGQAVCGANSGNPWNCITWEYGKAPYDNASFTFDGSDTILLLNNFSIDRKVEEKTLPPEFSTENIMKIKQGIGAEAILKNFGTPKSVRQSVCGGATGKPWICTTWEYGYPPYESATFTFSGEYGAFILNDFRVNRD